MGAVIQMARTLRPLRKLPTFLSSEIWRQLSTEQRMCLLGFRAGRIGDVTLGDIERVRREIPAPPGPGWIATPANDTGKHGCAP